MRRPTRPPTRLRFDGLEAREVPATAALTDGTLLITGTDQADTITVRQTATAIRVDGIAGSFARSAVSTVRINALGGNDTIRLDVAGAAVTRPAVVRAGSGDDSVRGGLGADYIDGEAGNDHIFGDAGADKIAGDTGADVLTGGSGNDSIAGGAGNDVINGDAGVDHLWGGDGFDVIAGGSGRDHVYDDFAFWAVQVTDADYVHHHILGVADNSGFGWFDANMPDADLRRQARAAARNNFVGRAETIALFEQATDGTDVNASEFASLKNLVNTDQVRIDAASRYFGQRIMNGDRANQWYTGGSGTRHALGDLHAGDANDKMQTLIDKWFLGKDHPMAKSLDRAAVFGYQPAAGRLFVDGPSADDVRQVNVNDCYWLAGLGAVARQNPQRIRDMFTANGDGTWTVRLYHDGHPEYVTVDNQLPVDENGRFVFANAGGEATFIGNELWVRLAEKAYAQFNESGWTGQDGTNSYNGVGGAVPTGQENHDGINFGPAGTALTQITGKGTSSGPTGLTSFADIKAKFDAGKAIVFNTPDDPPSVAVVGNHVYVMVGYDAAHQRITLRNPWGAGASQPELLTFRFPAVQANFSGWVAGDV